MYKLIGLGIFIPILILTAPNGFSDGGQEAATDFQNHIPFNQACDPTGVHTTDGKHTVYYCAGWYKGYTATWHNLVQAIPHAIPPPAQQSVKPAAGVTPQPPITSNAKANTFSTSASVGNTTNSNTATISVHTVNTIQGSNNKILIQEEPIMRKVILSNINNAILMAKGNIKGNISVSVNTKIINDMANRVSTTQGIDFTKALVATELVNAIKTMKTNGITTSANMTVTQQLPKVVIDNQAICTGISSPTSAACAFIINIHG